VNRSACRTGLSLHGPDHTAAPVPGQPHLPGGADRADRPVRPGLCQPGVCRLGHGRRRRRFRVPIRRSDATPQGLWHLPAVSRPAPLV